jgi:ATP/maltotriose-dependent transcriptional regulator MalT/DNA-binding SARP family transcriptional activator
MSQASEKLCHVLRSPSKDRGAAGVAPSLSIERPALQTILTKGLQRRLLLLAAPTGYGKTTALERAIRGLASAVVWCSLGTSESSLTDLVEALIRLICGGRRTVRRAKSFLDDSPFSLAQSLAQALRDALPDGVHLVLDAVDRSPAHADITCLAQHLLDLAPKGLRLAITTAGAPGLRLSLLARSQELAQVGKERMAFSPEEVGIFLSAAWETPVDQRLSAEAHRITEGWPQGLHALVAALPQPPDDPRAFGASPSARRFVPPPEGDLLQHVEGLDRELLLSVAFLPSVDLGDVGALTGVPGTADRVRRMAEMSSALTRVEPKRYIIHPSARGAILAAARREWGPERVRAHSLEVGRLLEATGRLEDGLQSFLEADDRDGASRVLRTLGPGYVMTRDPARLFPGAKQAMALQVSGEVGHLLCARAALHAGDFAACVEYCDIGLQTVEGRDSKLALTVVRSTARSALSTDFDSEDWEETSDQAAAHAWSQVWLASELLRVGRLEAAARCLDQARRNVSNHDDPFHAGWAALTRAEAHAQTGSYDAALGALGDASWLTAQTETALAAMHRGVLAEIETLKGDLEAAARHSREALGFADRVGARRRSFFHMLRLADLAVWQGDSDEARRRLEEAGVLARQLPADGGSARHALRASQARFSWSAGALEEALAAFEEIQQHRGETQHGELWNRLSMAHVLLRAGRDEDAEDIVVDVLERAEQMGSSHIAANALLLLAFGSQTTGDPSEVEDYLKKFWDLVRARGYGFMPASDVEIVLWADRARRAASDRERPRGAAVAAPAQLGAVRDVDERVSAGVQWPLVDVNTLGPLRITVRGVLREDVWKSGVKARRLLEILLCGNGFRASTDVVTDYLWPSASAERAKHSLHNEISNLRRILSKLGLEGHVEVRREQDAYRLYCSGQVRVTDRAFEALVGRGLVATGNEEALTLLAEAAELLTGTFLEDALYERFSDSRRVHLSELTTECLHSLAQNPLTPDTDAVRWWQKAIEHDPFDEEAYRGVVEACLRAGQKARATRFVDLMEKNLVEELGSELPEWAEELRSEPPHSE